MGYEARGEPGQPQPHGGQRDLGVGSDLFAPNPLGRKGGSTEYGLDSADLARERLDRKYALQLAALIASSQADGEADIGPSDQAQPAFSPKQSQREPVAPAAGTAAPS